MQACRDAVRAGFGQRASAGLFAGDDALLRGTRRRPDEQVEASECSARRLAASRCFVGVREWLYDGVRPLSEHGAEEGAERGQAGAERGQAGAERGQAGAASSCWLPMLRPVTLRP